MPVQVLVHDLPCLEEAVIGRKVDQPLVYGFVVLLPKHLGHIVNDTRRKNAVPLVQIPLL
jgi:hypothetical protein